SKMQNFMKEFREFAMRGSVVDLAVGVIIGTAFGAIVTSLVYDIIMPPIGVLIGGDNFSDLAIRLNDDASINYGNFVNTVINFLIIAIAIFMVVKWMNSLKKKEEEAPAEPTTQECPFCLTEIPLKATRCPHCTSHLNEGTA